MSNPSGELPRSHRPNTQDPFEHPILKALRNRVFITTQPPEDHRALYDLSAGSKINDKAHKAWPLQLQLLVANDQLPIEREGAFTQAVQACLRATKDFENWTVIKRDTMDGATPNERMIYFDLIDPDFLKTGGELPSNETRIEISKIMKKMHQASLDMDAKDDKQKGK